MKKLEECGLNTTQLKNDFERYVQRYKDYNDKIGILTMMQKDGLNDEKFSESVNKMSDKEKLQFKNIDGSI
jgi:hypothetical protein